MTEFWKSQARKYCDVCSCWLADQKASRESHEQGKRHKDNVQRRIAEARKKMKDHDSMQRHQSSVIEAMERAAAASMLKDLRDNPELRGKFGLSAEQEQALVRKASDDVARREKEVERTAEKERISAFINEKLQSNSKPESSTIGPNLPEPKQTNSANDVSATTSSTKIKFKAPKSGTNSQSAEKSHPYGTWTPVNQVDTYQSTAASIDMQLPAVRSYTMLSRLREAHEVSSALLKAESNQHVALIESGAKRSAAVANRYDESTPIASEPVTFKRVKSHAEKADMKPKHEFT